MQFPKMSYVIVWNVPVVAKSGEMEEIEFGKRKFKKGARNRKPGVPWALTNVEETSEKSSKSKTD